jgi:AraC family transcriptional regulator
MPGTPRPADPYHAYVARINRVVDHISAHIRTQGTEPLDLATLAGVAHFSPWHFHRVFQAMTGETLADCVRRLRLEAAAQRLLASPPQAALTVALDVGFASAEVFTRAFRAHFGMTPTAWRRGGWREWSGRQRRHLSKIHQEVHKAHQATATLFRDDPDDWPAGQPTTEKGLTMNVEIKTLPAMRLAYLRHTGPYGHPGIPQTWQRFMTWHAQNARATVGTRMYGISQDNPDVTPPGKCRYDCCVEVPPAFQPKGEVGVQAFDGGRYACVRFTGTSATIHDAWMKMFGEWLPGSGWQAGDAPSLELYGDDMAPDPKTGAFTCWLCVPVRPL